MPGRLAPYKNPEVLEVVSQWFKETYGETAQKRNKVLIVYDLYQSYCEYTIRPEYTHQRLNASEFAKCIVACKILDIGGVFQHRPTYEPAVSAVTRATA